MMRKIRHWAWIVPVVGLLMVGEAYLLKGFYSRQAGSDQREASAQSPQRPATTSARPAVKSAAEPVQTWTPSVREPRHKADSLTAASDTTATDTTRVSTASRTEEVIDSLEKALHEMEKVVNALTDQVRQNQRHRIDTLRRRTPRAANEPQTEVARAVQQGRRIIDQRIRSEGIDRHLDTLSTWRYHWPQLQERIVGVNSTVYEYVESIRTSYSEADITRIREELLSYWKTWSDRTAEKIKRVKNEDKNER